MGGETVLAGKGAEVAAVPRRLCLNMIVKNESRILERCLAAIAPHIACWVMCDTGSTDGTQDLIRNFFAARAIPGELHEFPFVDFGQARNEGLKRARAAALDYDYILLCDADMELKVEDPDFRTKLTAIGYGVEQRSERERYWNCRLLRRDCTALYKGVTHEWISPGGDGAQLRGIWYLDHANGANRPEKIERDTRLLEEDLERDPENPRTYFYLGQTHKLAGRFADAARCYRRRVKMGGWEEEAWYAQMQEAICRLKLGDEAAFERGCLAAFNRRPHRAEPLFHLAHFHREAGRHEVAMLYAEAGQAIPLPPKDILFIDNFIYRIGLPEEYALAAIHAASPAKRDRGRRICDHLGLSRDVPLRTRGHARRAMRDYAAPAAELLPGAVAVEIVGDGPDGPKARAATLAVCGDRLHLLQTLAPGRPGHAALLPRLAFCALDIAGALATRQAIAIPDDFPTVTAERRWDIAGISLFARDGAPWIVGTMRGASGTWNGSVLARIDTAARRLADWEILPRETLPVPAADWQPLVMPGPPGFLAGIDPTLGVSLAPRSVWQGRPGCAADHLHPASQLVPFANGWLLLLREAAPPGEPGGPMLRLGWLAQGLELQRLSLPFRFSNHPPGATLGLAQPPGEQRLAASYTTDAGATRLALMPADAVAGALLPLSEILSRPAP
jgi:tetratricopeptide (TPR) repeat protein